MRGDPFAGSGKGRGATVSLRQYVEAFSQETLAQTARVVSSEGVTLVERHTGALFGSIDGLQTEMQVTDQSCLKKQQTRS